MKLWWIELDNDDDDDDDDELFLVAKLIINLIKFLSMSMSVYVSQCGCVVCNIAC